MLIGALAVFFLAIIAARTTGPGIVSRLEAATDAAIARNGGRPVEATFVAPDGSLSRNPLLSGGEGLNEAVRDKVAKAVSAVPGVGGVRWADGTALAESSAVVPTQLHCQDDVEALLNARTIRFEESSTRIDAASRELVDEVATALRPCLGSIIAITGHTDSSGPEPGNITLSRERAEAVRDALISRGIPADGLRVRGMGSRNPVEGLAPTDPANRRIEFSVIATVPIKPTPVDTPGPR
ncbi:OmpA family protein [Altererythrobacter salegens]|uniref:OmpA family protein n=1 Tax=Croceibacterium salegens TaxID=1737568 RepID=A0A6I4SU02_9SPHN|nr:OmpA family protein [Croceibacterium salegens]